MDAMSICFCFARFHTSEMGRKRRSPLAAATRGGGCAALFQNSHSAPAAANPRVPEIMLQLQLLVASYLY